MEGSIVGKMGGGKKSLFGFLGFKRVRHTSSGRKAEIITTDTKKRAEVETGTKRRAEGEMGTRNRGSTGGLNYIDRKAEDFIEKVRRQRDSPEQQRGATVELPSKRGIVIELPIM